MSELTTVKIGGKHLKVPAGWRLVTDRNDTFRDGDMFANCAAETPHWMYGDELDVGTELMFYDSVIRREIK